MKTRDREHFPSATRKWGAMMAVGLSIFMATLDVNIVNVSLPTLVRALDADFPTIQWVILAYVLVLTSTILGMARLGDMFGKKSLFSWGLGVFTLGSLLCGLAPSAGWLVGFRALQGIGASMTQALGVAIVTEVFPSSERGRAMGLIGSVVSVGLAMGPALGGLLIGLAGWRSVFLVNVPIGVGAVVAAARFIPATVQDEGSRRFDFPGALILFATLVCYALGMTMGQRLGFHDAAVLILLASALAGLGAFIVVEKTVREPMVELHLFKNALFSLNLLMGVLAFVVIAGAFVIPFFLELVKGYSPATVGLLMMVHPLSMGLVAPVAGMLSDRFGSRGISLLGLLTAAGGCLSIGSLHEGVSLAGCVLRLAPFGIGMGLFQSPNNSAVMGAVSQRRLGIASGLLALTRTLGNTSGIPLFGVVFSSLVLSAAGPSASGSVTDASVQALVAGFSGTYRLAALVIGAACVLAAAALYLERRKLPKPH